MASAFALAIFSGKIVLLYEWKMTAVIFHSPFHALGSRRQTASSHRTADSFLFGHEFGLRHPAFASCLGRHLRLAGRCPNSNSLFPPLAAVVAVASHSIARPIALRATGSHPSGRSSEKLSAVLRLPFLLSDLLQMLHAVLEAVEEGIHILRGVVGAEGHPDGGVDGQRVAPHGCQRVAGLTAPAGAG